MPRCFFKRPKSLSTIFSLPILPPRCFLFVRCQKCHPSHAKVFLDGFFFFSTSQAFPRTVFQPFQIFSQFSRSFRILTFVLPPQLFGPIVCARPYFFHRRSPFFPSCCCLFSLWLEPFLNLFPLRFFLSMAFPPFVDTSLPYRGPPTTRFPDFFFFFLPRELSTILVLGGLAKLPFPKRRLMSLPESRFFYRSSRALCPYPRFEDTACILSHSHFSLSDFLVAFSYRTNPLRRYFYTATSSLSRMTPGPAFCSSTDRLLSLLISPGVCHCWRHIS